MYMLCQLCSKCQKLKLSSVCINIIKTPSIDLAMSKPENLQLHVLELYSLYA